MPATSSTATTGDAPHSITRASDADPLTIGDHEPAKVTFSVACRARLPRCVFELAERAVDADSTHFGGRNLDSEHIDRQHHSHCCSVDGGAGTLVDAGAGEHRCVPVDPSVLVPVALGNKPFAADGDTLVSQHNGYTGDPNAILQTWLVAPMAVPSGPDVRLLGFERTVGINSTTAMFLTGAIDPEAVLANLQATLAPSPTYTVTPTTRTEGTITIHGFDAKPTTVQGDPPGWTVEASAVDQLGIVRIKRSDYTFDKVVPTFDDLPTELQIASSQSRHDRRQRRWGVVGASRTNTAWSPSAIRRNTARVSPTTSPVTSQGHE